ncbi:MAG TPA: PKD domain-containing protein [Vicinamibacterales bacterium]|nr:PKD domain-containing protein [Vicinamibacterales bacterium]
MKRLLSLASIVLISGCAMHDAAGPSNTGPAEAALSLRMFATPDHVPQDGLHSSAIAITAFDPGGNPVAVQVHLDVFPSGFGTISANSNGDVSTTTDATKPVTVQYMPPVATLGANTTVTIRGTIVRAGTNIAENSNQQITVTAQPTTLVSSLAPQPVITLTPSTITFPTNSQVTFDATASCGTQMSGGVCPGTVPIAAVNWNFGDNTVASGSIVSHVYTAAGSYTVTLTVTNAQGTTTALSQVITVGAVAAPTASFNVSPTSIPANGCNPSNAFFNAVSSTAAAGHSLARYDWDFGDGVRNSTTTANTAHCYTLANTYHSTLTVYDDAGQHATASQDVVVK